MDRSEANLKPYQPEARKAIPNSVMGMVIFVTTEAMFFSALISAYLITKSEYVNWPPMGQPRLPVFSTFINALVLVSSAVFLYFAARSFKKENGRTNLLMFFCLLTGSLFLIVQGYEWVRLIDFGLTLKSSNYGSFFYTIVGAHAIHVLGALLFMYLIYFKSLSHSLKKSTLQAAQVLWYFVVGIWPVIYAIVYLG